MNTDSFSLRLPQLESQDFQIYVYHRACKIFLGWDSKSFVCTERKGFDVFGCKDEYYRAVLLKCLIAVGVRELSVCFINKHSDPHT